MEEIRKKAEDTKIRLYRGSESSDSFSQSSSDKRGLPIYRLRKWRQKSRIASAAERNLAFAMSEMDRLCAANDLPDKVRDGASEIYRKAIGNCLVRGRSTDCIIATSIYSACRINHIARTLDEIAESCDISKKELGRTYRFISKKLNLGPLLADPSSFIKRLCSELDLDQKVSDYSIELIERASQKGTLSGLGPLGVAAGAVYISAHLLGEHRSQSDVATAADISEVTLRCRYKKLAADLEITMEF